MTNDTVHEATETVSLSLSSPVGCTLAATYAPATLSILDNDEYPSVDFSQPSFSVNEGDGTATITVSLSKAPGPGNSATVHYATEDGTAHAGTDYIATLGTLTFGAADTAKTFTVSITNDAGREDTETVVLRLSSPSGCLLGSGNNPARLDIVDDDPLPGVDFQQARYVAQENGGTIEITVELSAPPGVGFSATVEYATADLTAHAGQDYESAAGTLDFGPDDTSRTFVVTINDDALEEGTEAFRLTLFNPVGCTLGTANNPALVTIVDDEWQNPADINRDGAVDALDIQLAINAALGADVPNADLNGDGEVNALDIQLVVNAVLGA